jgi:hypothetical protein
MLDLSKEKEIDANLRPCMHLIECAFAVAEMNGKLTSTLLSI